LSWIFKILKFSKLWYLTTFWNKTWNFKTSKLQCAPIRQIAIMHPIKTPKPLKLHCSHGYNVLRCAQSFRLKFSYFSSSELSFKPYRQQSPELQYRHLWSHSLKPFLKLNRSLSKLTPINLSNFEKKEKQGKQRK
jgi:hypothetical protein